MKNCGEEKKKRTQGIEEANGLGGFEFYGRSSGRNLSAKVSLTRCANSELNVVFQTECQKVSELQFDVLGLCFREGEPSWFVHGNFVFSLATFLSQKTTRKDRRTERGDGSGVGRIVLLRCWRSLLFIHRMKSVAGKP